MAKTVHPVPRDQFEELHQEGFGVCLSCGDLNQGTDGWCESDAEGYQCVDCHVHGLVGLDEAFITGLIRLED